jgi:hypothetical protein
MSPSTRYIKKHAKARQRRRTAQERLERDRRQAQRAAIDGGLLVVVIGDGKLVVPVDFAIRGGPTPQALGCQAATNCIGCR